MLEEMNDNLPQADGNLENQEVETAVETENIIELTDAQVADDSLVFADENQVVMNAIAIENAEASETETPSNSVEIPLLDYDSMPMEELVEELQKLTSTANVMAVRNHVEGIKTAFLSKYYHFMDEKRHEFEKENHTDEEFHYHYAPKVKFDELFTAFRNRKNTYIKEQQNNLESNLKVRLALVEELKNLVHTASSIPNALKQLNDIRERWKNAGAIPKDKYNHVWNNFHFHIENFYDFLHLDRDARDMDFKHNLDLKLKIIARCEELVNEQDIHKAFRELQDLHKIWKEEIGPVSRERREEIWTKFSDLTKQLHDKREVIFEQLRGSENENLEKKNEIIAKLKTLATEKVDSHNLWIAQVAKVEALRNDFFAIGKVPADVIEETWGGFKTACKDFNILKNSFYKDLKKEQDANLNKKYALIEQAKIYLNTDDFLKTTPLMKQIQEDWRAVGHVPLKFSDKVWKEFKGICNDYFDKLKENRNKENPDEITSFDKKKEYLETIKSFEMTGDHKTDLEAIKLHIENWKSFGRVPAQRRHIEGKFNKILDTLFEKLSASKKDTDMARFSNKVDQMAGDSRKLDNEKIFLIRKIEEVQGNIFQLENNIQFFANAKNAKKENPLVAEVRKNIEIQKQELAILKEKLKQLRSLKQE